MNRLLTFFLLAASISFAQVGTGRLDGTVVDATGGLMPGAKITATNQATQAKTEASTNADGFFVFPSLAPGHYDISVEATGFRTVVVTGVEINVATAVTQAFKLEVGQVTEHVQVEADTVRVQTAEAQLGRTVSLKDIDTLPVLGRAPINLAIFSPGVQISNPGDVTFSNVNGQRQGASNSTLDGIDVNDAVVPRLGLSMTANNMDSVGEVHIVTSGAKAEYGRNAGGQVELITRSGTNQFHGNLFDYLRNNDLNANSFFNNLSGVPVAKYIQNLFGGSVGGRVIRNKTFFFFNYQGSRIAQDQTRNRTVLTPAAKRGIFTWKTAAGDIGTYSIVANDPRGIGIDPVMAAIFKVLPDPNNTLVGDTYNTAGFQFNNPAGSWNNSYTGKADHNLTANHHLFFRYSWFKTYSIDNLNNADATYPGFPQGNQGGVRWGFSAGSDWAFATTMVNELRVGHQSASVDFNRPGRLQGPTITSNLFFDPYNAAFAQGRNSPVNEVTDYLTKVRSNHTLKFGANVRLTEQWGYNLAGTSGGIYPNVTTATTLGNSVPTSVGPAGITSTQRTTFEGLYNDVLGRMNQVVQSYFSDLTKFQAAGTGRVRDFNVKEMGFFGQDDWKVNRKLTLNFGLRWEFSGIPSEASGLVGSIDQAASMSTAYTSSNLSVVKGGQWYKPDYNNFAPRVGFAYDVSGNLKTAIRGSIGVFYDRMIGATISSVDSATPGFGQDVFVYPNQNGTDVRAGDGIPATPAPPTPLLTLPNSRSTSISIFNPNLRTPYVVQYNFNVQRELPRHVVLEVGYVGSKGIKLFMAQNLNQQKIFGDFLKSFQELQAFQANNANAPSPGNTLVRIFGSPTAAINAIGATTVSQGQIGNAATTVDRTNYTKYVAAGVADTYLRNYPQYINVLEGTNAGRSYYNSLQVSVRKQFGALTVVSNYTWAKSIDNSSVEGNGFANPTDSFNLALSRARSDFDRAHSFNGSFAYLLPVGKGKRFGGSMPHIVDSLIGGWEVGSLVIWQGGGPFTILSQRNTTFAATTTSYSWANYTGSRNIGEVTRTPDGVWFYPRDTFVTNFTYPVAGDYGNTGRNTFRGPRYFDTDVSLVKRFRIYESHAITFRAEAYNVFNNVNFANPTVSLTAPATFGKLGSIVGTPRVMQMALRYDF